MKGPQGIWTFVKRLKDPKLFGEILDKDAVEGRVLPMYTHVCIKCWQSLQREIMLFIGKPMGRFDFSCFYYWKQ